MHPSFSFAGVDQVEETMRMRSQPWSSHLHVHHQDDMRGMIWNHCWRWSLNSTHRPYLPAEITLSTLTSFWILGPLPILQTQFPGPLFAPTQNDKSREHFSPGAAETGSLVSCPRSWEGKPSAGYLCLSDIENTPFLTRLCGVCSLPLCLFEFVRVCWGRHSLPGLGSDSASRLVCFVPWWSFKSYWSGWAACVQMERGGFRLKTTWSGEESWEMCTWLMPGIQLTRSAGILTSFHHLRNKKECFYKYVQNIQ